MIALDGALRRLTVCQLTRESRGNGGGLRPRVWLRLRAAAWGQLDPGWNLTIGKARPVSPCLGAHEAHPNYFVWGCFPKIEWAPAYVDSTRAAACATFLTGPAMPALSCG